MATPLKDGAVRFHRGQPHGTVAFGRSPAYVSKVAFVSVGRKPRAVVGNAKDDCTGSDVGLHQRCARLCVPRLVRQGIAQHRE